MKFDRSHVGRLCFIDRATWAMFDDSMMQTKEYTRTSDYILPSFKGNYSFSVPGIILGIHTSQYVKGQTKDIFDTPMICVLCDDLIGWISTAAVNLPI